ncbi:glycosyltransferase family 2 protein [Anaerosacchariphilus polymeriproducens]|uniref:Glycosyltransferase family 2 protein n=1 Tax=Anaerosacchariphilus polymeriproducens TaxID=1812858 RepID=A0A371ATB7_9FIRM|nr:glycosyltransferase family 2 protein [Anaerosacchariphilus polymeriproducens]RDU22813.1 glycosyltransferase family 2 protein [Anaerosacchariphilus polymeriproducens]
MGEKKKLVSVIMPVYNTEKYLREAVDSILKQTYSYFELILINDGSTDKSLDIIIEYAKKDQRVVMLSRSTNSFIEAVNDGIRIARGEYIARMDSDDISHPNRFQKQVEFLNTHEDIYLLGTNYSIIFDDGLTENTKKKYIGSHKRGQEPVDNNNVFLSINEGQKFMQPSTMMRREIYEKVGLYKDFLIEDIEFYFRVAAKGLGIAKLEEELFHYRAREGSRSTDEFRKKQTHQIIQMKLQYLFSELIPQKKIRSYLIWGADISGEEALNLLKDKFPNAECKAFIDPYKAGKILQFVPIISPEEFPHYFVDYIFICTQSGARPAREFLKKEGKEEIKEFFKIS